MKMIASASVAAFAIALWATGTVDAQDGKAQATSCRRVVEGFYKWYVPESYDRSRVSRYDVPLKSKVYKFDAELVRLLRASEAYEDRGGDIINVDPFLGVNGDPEKYVVGNVREKGDTCKADLYGESSGKREPNPLVTAELVRRNGSWIFFNFHYPTENDPVDKSGLRGWIRDQIRQPIRP